ncbi:unnamed protein product [Prorocentrum cordatum]|uniref:Uncharacterized protein n=1 Tax=Prorocentrum cordatum TaxID=2364126 RepID=A0ABN9YH14_9DINO|nr:unnamed protein product [Polarella glacialis]
MMARAGLLDGDPGGWQQRRSRAERTAARRRALGAADNGLAAARAERDAAQSELCTVRKCFEAVVGDSELADRIATLAPALSALLRGGGAPSAEEVLRRSVALHADAPEGVSIATAPCEDLRRLQESDRLEGRQFTEGRLGDATDLDISVEICVAEPATFGARGGLCEADVLLDELAPAAFDAWDPVSAPPETLSSDGGGEVAAASDAWDPDAAPPEALSSDGSEEGAIAEALAESSWSAMVEAIRGQTMARRLSEDVQESSRDAPLCVVLVPAVP